MPYSSQDESADSNHPIYKRPRRRAWHRQFFHDHPGYQNGDPDAFAGRGATHDKVKVWCKRCFAQRLAYERARVTREGEPEPDEAAIIDYMWRLPLPEAGWIQGRPANCLVHLRDCELQDSHVRQEAGARHGTRARRRSQRPDGVSPVGRVGHQGHRRRSPDAAPRQQAGAETEASQLTTYEDPRQLPLPSVPPSFVPASPPHAYTTLEYASPPTYLSTPIGPQTWQSAWDQGMAVDPAVYTTNAPPGEASYPSEAASSQANEPVYSEGALLAQPQYDHQAQTWSTAPYQSGSDPNQSAREDMDGGTVWVDQHGYVWRSPRDTYNTEQGGTSGA